LEPRRIEWIRICDVRPDPLNAKLHHLGEIVTSIKKRGFVELPAVDERTGKLVAGHGRIEALAALKKDGGELPKGLKLADDGEWLVPVLHGWASKDDTDAKAYLVASNRLVEVGGWDDAALESLLVSIAKEGGAEALLGYRVRWRRRRQDTVGPGEGAVRGETPRRCLPGACRGLW
jgi:ParB-like chromosome segregation protein Spo0J